MNEGEKLKLDYEQTTQNIHTLADIRFKLLAFVPVVTGAAISLFRNIDSHETIIAISLLGFIVTLGIMFYDQRNTQIYDALHIRAKSLEVLLGLQPIANLKSPDKNRREWVYGGAFLDRPGRSLKLFGKIGMWHDRGLTIIYAAALGGWCYLLVSAIMKIIVAGQALSLGIRVGAPVIIAAAIFWQLRRFDKATDELRELPDYIQNKLLPGKENHPDCRKDV
ncbi:hypothetical protein ES703_89304 [subsurface metagenome]